MVQLASSILFGLLAITAQAGEFRVERRHNKHHHHHHSSSTPYPAGNSTAPAGTGTGISSAEPKTTTSLTTSTSTSTSVVVSTVVVSPLPASPAPAAGGEGQTPKPAQNGGSKGPAKGPAEGPADQCGSPTTVTVTVHDTVTAGPSSTSAAGVVKPAKLAGAPSDETTSTTTLTSLSTTFVKVYSTPPPKKEDKKAAPKVEPSPTSTSTTPAAAEKESPAPKAKVAAQPAGDAAAEPQQEQQKSKQTAPKPAPVPQSKPKAKVNSAPAAVGKRGVAYESGDDCSQLSGLAWSFNWASTPGKGCANTEYVASLQKPTDVSGFASAIKGQNIKFAKSFNEVDMTVENGGTNVDPSKACELFKAGMPAGSGIKLGAPSVTSYNTTSSKFTGGLSGIAWLQKFNQVCGDAQIDFCDLHWYGGGGDGASQGKIFLEYVDQAIKDVDAMYGSSMPLWFSEISATPQADADPQVNKDFLDVVLSELDSNPRVQRYAYFEAKKINGNAAGQRYSA